MVITYYGLSCFKVQSGDLTIAFDPPSKESDLRPPRFETHIALSSHNHPRHNGLKELSGKKDRDPFFILGPGEYEVEGVRVIGFPSWHDREKGKTRGPNTIYSVAMEGVSLCHLGDIGTAEIENDTLEGFGEIDVLFVPIGGKDVVEPDEAAKIVKKLEPKAVIPMHYAEEHLKAFIKELGEDVRQLAEKAEEKFTFKKKELPEEGTRVVILAPAIG
ncbi:MAG: MBL fold metallo-hydrolase [Patescibacteria group bacterium]